MKAIDKMNFLIENHYSEWINTRSTIEDEFSKKQTKFGVCGRLATGLHELRCRKFKIKVDSETIKRLKHLIKPI